MKLSKPRINPLTEAEWTDEQRKTLEPRYKEGIVYNVIGTLANHWEAAKKFNVWAFHVMGDPQTLPPRERELLILRIGWLCQAEYEWGQHVLFGREAGLTDQERWDVVAAASELAANSATHGGGRGTPRAWRGGDRFLVQVDTLCHRIPDFIGKAARAGVHSGLLL